MLELTDSTFDSTIAALPSLVIVDFYTSWCGPCRMQVPILEHLSQTTGDAVVAKVDLDANPVVGDRFKISKVPTLLILKNGQEVKRMIGVQKEATLLKEIESLK